ncbi:hypothetical protein [Streptomyces violaceorubidus]|nr:hypothetical protein [Streptomyces violaceorubidus]
MLSVAADAAGEELTRRVLFQLPPGYDLLFGRPQDTTTPSTDRTCAD